MSRNTRARIRESREYLLSGTGRGVRVCREEGNSTRGEKEKRERDPDIGC